MSIFYQSRSESIRFYTSENNTYATHLHRQVELIVMLDGTLTVTVEQRKYLLTAGEGVLVFPNRLHGLNTEKNSRILLCIFDSDFCHSFRPFFRDNTAEPVFCMNQLSSHSRIALEGLLNLTKEFQRGADIPESVILHSQGYLTLLLTDIFNALSLHAQAGYTDLELEQQLLLYIDSHYTDNLTLSLLSREFGVSPFRLSRIFSDRLYTSFPQYVNSRRLEYAADLLSDTSLSVTRIALDAGFGSTRTFFREFRKRYGSTPGEYRKLQAAPAESLPRS